jgi:hypothetical protein
MRSKSKKFICSLVRWWFEDDVLVHMVHDAGQEI